MRQVYLRNFLTSALFCLVGRLWGSYLNFLSSPELRSRSNRRSLVAMLLGMTARWRWLADSRLLAIGWKFGGDRNPAHCGIRYPKTASDLPRCARLHDSEVGLVKNKGRGLCPRPVSIVFPIPDPVACYLSLITFQEVWIDGVFEH